MIAEEYRPRNAAELAALDRNLAYLRDLAATFANIARTEVTDNTNEQNQFMAAGVRIADHFDTHGFMRGDSDGAGTKTALIAVLALQLARLQPQPGCPLGYDCAPACSLGYDCSA